MSDILGKIKETEKLAAQIIHAAEAENQSKLDQARHEISALIEQRRNKAIKTIHENKKSEIDQAILTKTRLFDEKAEQFKQSLGDIPLKKEKTIEFLLKIIKTYLE